MINVQRLMFIGQWGDCGWKLRLEHWAWCTLLDVSAGRNSTLRFAMKIEDADRLEDRLIEFGAQIIVLTDQLPASRAANHIAQQLLRSGTSPAPNYGEARGAESRADFVHKLGVALKELNETQVWLKMLARSKLAARATIGLVLDECQQLARLLNTSIQTARRNGRQERP